MRLDFLDLEKRPERHIPWRNHGEVHFLQELFSVGLCGNHAGAFPFHGFSYV